MTRNLKIVILVLGLLSVIAVAATTAYVISAKRPSPPNGGTTTGAAPVGGLFALVNQDGETVTLAPGSLPIMLMRLSARARGAARRKGE